MGIETTKANAVQTQEPIFVIKPDGVLALAITTVMAKALKHGKDKGHYSIEYFVEDLLSDKLRQYSDYLDADEDRKNRELFVKAMNALPVPDMTKAESITVYVNQVNGLKRKYRQGETKPTGGL